MFFLFCFDWSHTLSLFVLISTWAIAITTIDHLSSLSEFIISGAGDKTTYFRDDAQNLRGHGIESAVLMSGGQHI